jgi:putative transposase
MYEWQRLSPAERQRLLEQRRARSFPAHGLPHFKNDVTDVYSCTASNYLHVVILGRCSSRMDAFECALKSEIKKADFELLGHCLMPNHYHVLIAGSDIRRMRRFLGMLHGRTSHEWNVEDGCVGRKVWFGCFDKPVYSLRQHYCSLNYIHWNPVQKGFCQSVEEWKWSSARSFIGLWGKERFDQISRDFPGAESAMSKYDKDI